MSTATQTIHAGTALEEFIAKNADKDPKAILDLVLAESERIKAEARAMAEVTFNEKGLQSASMAGLWRLSQIYAGSDLIPEQYRRKPYDCFIALQISQRMGVDCFMFMQNSYVVHGRPGLEAKLGIALANKSGVFSTRIAYKMTGAGKAKTCTAYATDAKTGEVVEGPPVSWELVEAEGWSVDKTTRNGGVQKSKWNTMPDLMFRYRAAMFLIRTVCPEVLMGLPTIEEMQDIEHVPAPPTETRQGPDSRGRSLDDLLPPAPTGNGNGNGTKREEPQTEQSSSDESGPTDEEPGQTEAKTDPAFNPPNEADELAADNADLEALAAKNEYRDLLAGLTYDTEVNGWMAEVNMHGNLRLEDKKELIKMGQDKLATMPKKPKRGERSNAR